ncbi:MULTISPECIES: PEP-CTERM sorting domain-containing protein [unclassified Colwellia]|uniref:PEP-CTERM sorting domain-containing protein n=1 Tax=unclassified Colwellia TaxID=196834 RepID=UPI0015F3C23A|nr:MULTISPECIES: PEP-CTERM sorting domain-containing protein [unclassified Colwellia]MBA6353512.1 PEP-CTERM sorting domain-containing protein [Colwellia sp. BRX9-1]MBA6357083.1 PEP-CTERM sorting domain-containing protein [Colwellia sp. BRX8-3]MBA6361939.1 PEP-CTERM sorting domain-containing protein [Colwellia sp. BRX8-6]MBA6369720.1 PEP-CTERM sorting domain-containing protein [Colwellia sp. BRX8-5]MBA6377400.1 PEP-CTERM sorting domain-containing protein [Colwellia sp. BRX8-2]
MKKLLIVATLILCATFGGNANAGLITLSADQSDVLVGEMMEITLNATGFDEFDVFSLNVDFDTSVFSFLPSTFTTELSRPFIMEFNQVGSGVAIGFVNFTPSSGDFLLGKFTLQAIGAGTTDFSLVVNEFTLSDPLDFFAVATPVNADVLGRVSASVTDVPEPSTLAIFALGLMGLMTRSLKKKS